MFNKNLISILDLGIEQQTQLFELASKKDKLFTKYCHSLEGKVLGSLFFQPSTRTQFSFQSAFIKLGGQYIGCNNIDQIRSGPPYFESITDLGTIISNYCDLIVMRTIDNIQTLQLIQGAQIPVILAGSGNIEHPTQALTDMFTIKQLLGSLKDHEILILGTPRQRTINSFIKGLSAWGKNHYHILCQSGIEVSEEVSRNLNDSQITYYHSWEEVWDANIAHTISVIYIDKIFNETNRNNNFVPDRVKFSTYFGKNTIILHPLPRTVELPLYMDQMPSAKYFLQAQNGLYVRAALFLYYLYNKN